MNALQNWRAYLPTKERLYLLLGVLGVVMLALGIFLYVAFTLIPAVQTRSELIGVVATMEQNAAMAETAQAAAPATVEAQIAAAQTRVNDAALAFLSEPQAAEALERLYRYAQESGVTIAELQAQAAPQGEGSNLYRLITFGLRVTGAFPRLVNFLARIRETKLSGFVVSNVNITEGEAQHIASMNVALYTSPYAAATRPITGVLMPPNLPPLPTDLPLPTTTELPDGTLLPGPTLPFTVTMIPTLAPGATNTPIIIIPPTSVPPVVIPTMIPTAIPTTPSGSTPLPTAPIGCANLLGNGDFELDGSWLLGPSVKPPQYTSSQRHGGARAMQLGNPPEAGALNRPSYSSIRQQVIIPAGASVVTLRWWHFYGSAEAVAGDPGTAHDRQEVLLLRADEKVLAVLQRVRRNESGWQQETVDLTPYRGQTVYLYFNVFNDGNGAAAWMYLDDVQLDTCVGTTPVPTAATPGSTAATNTPIVTVATNTPTTPVTAAMTPTATPTLSPMAPTPSPTVPTGCANLLTNGDFENDGSWILGPSVLLPQYTTSQKHGGTRAMQLGNPPASGQANRGSYSSIRQLVNIPADATAVTLRWWHLYGSAEAVAGDPGTASDRQEVLLLTPDERVLAVLQRVRRNESGWQQETVDLTPYRGQSFYLYFNVYNNGNSAATWAYIDDVQLDTCVSNTPAPTNTPIVIPTAIHTPTTSPTPPFSCTNLVANGDFENDGSWITGISATPPQVTTSQKYSGARSMELGNASGYSSIRQLVTIPADASIVTLHWWHFYGTGETVTTELDSMSDRQEVLVLRSDEMPLAIVQRVRRNDSGWQQEAVDLTGYRGQSIYLYFNVFNDGAGGSTWMYLDAVQLEVCSPSITPVATLTSVAYICEGDVYNCSNFTTQADAQQVFNYCASLGSGDIHRLDQDNDSIACEELSSP